VWSIPTLTVILLGGVAWIGAHELDPAKPIKGSSKPLTIQAVSLDWKWLFIYPDQKVATINTLTVPVGVPLQYQLTSASVMNAFFIPQLGSLIYTMNGMTTRLNLRADTPGTLQGLSGHFSGDGFSDMHFDVHVVPPEQFSRWALDGSRANTALDEQSYQQIARPSMKNEPAIYRLADPNLFRSIATQKIPPSPGAPSGVIGAALPGVADAR
jgi:cytochrome o ubiquinol oxidase subunit 2